MLTPALAVPIGVVLNTSDGVGMLNPGGRIRSDPVGSSLTESAIGFPPRTANVRSDGCLTTWASG